MASNLFHREAYRVAFAFDLGEDFGFVFDFFEVLPLVFRDDVDVIFRLPRGLFTRARVRGASLTGSATSSVRPVFTELDER